MTPEEVEAYKKYMARIQAGENPPPAVRQWLADMRPRFEQLAEDDGGNFFIQRGEAAPGTWEAAGADFGKALGSGVKQGVSGIIGTPGALINLGARAFGHDFEEEGDASFLPGFQSASEGVTSATDVVEEIAPGFGTEGDIGYEPETRAGDYAQTVAEFSAGALLPGGGGANSIRNIFLPAFASETAGQLTEGTPLEPWARVGAAVATPAASKSFMDAFFGHGGTSSRKAAADALRREGVQPSAGQTTGSKALLYTEDATHAGQDLHAESVRSYTNAAINRATRGRQSLNLNIDPDAAAGTQVNQILRQSGKVMDDLAEGNFIPRTPELVTEAKRIASQYQRGVASGSKRGVFKDFADKVSRGAVSGDQFQYFRGIFSALRQDPDTATRTAAMQALDLIEESMEASIRARGNLTDLQRYKDARAAYRDGLTLRRALGLGETKETISPANLKSAVKAKQGEEAYVSGQNEFDDLITAGQEVMIFPKSSGTAERGAAMMGPLAAYGPAAGAGGAAGGAIGLLTGLSPLQAGAVAALGAGGSTLLRNQAVPRQIMQNMLSRRIEQPLLQGAPATAPGVLSIFNQ